MSVTKNLGLTLPAGSDYADVAVLNENWEKVDEAVSKKAELGADGKIPAEQLPDMQFEPAGAAAAVQKALDEHTKKKDNPHGVTAAQVGAAPAGHTHDDRYYTEGETDSLLARKQDAATAIHTGNIGAQTVNYANGANYANSATAARDPTPGSATLKNIYAGTADIGAGAALATGTIYLCYE